MTKTVKLYFLMIMINSIQTLFSRLSMILEENIIGVNQCLHMSICDIRLTDIIIRMFTLLISSNILIFLYSLRKKRLAKFFKQKNGQCWQTKWIKMYYSNHMSQLKLKRIYLSLTENLLHQLLKGNYKNTTHKLRHIINKTWRGNISHRL